MNRYILMVMTIASSFSHAHDVCTVEAGSLSEAVILYDKQCQPSCQSISGIWQCTASEPAEDETVPSSPDGTVTFTGETLLAAKQGFSALYGQAPLDCDPNHGGSWTCSSGVIGASAPGGITQPATGGMLLVLHYDSSYDPDDLQAMVAAREVLDDHPDVKVLAVNGTKRAQNKGVISGSQSLLEALFPETLNALQDSAKNDAAARWTATLNAGGRVKIAEGGPSDFTAEVLRRLNISDSAMKRITVVQHSYWNENNTVSSNLSYVKSKVNYIKIADGNYENSTPDYQQENDQAFVKRALASRYGAKWKQGFDAMNRIRDGRVDFSDTVELTYILGIDKAVAPTTEGFADKYF